MSKRQTSAWKWTRIQSTVSDGWVTLEGSVDVWHQREDAARAVRGLTGVRGVTNLVALSTMRVDVEQVRREIRGGARAKG